MANWIEFATIKRTVPLLAVLTHYRIGELRRSGKDHLRGRCPLHGGAGRDTFHANTAKQVFHCFSCAAGGSVLDLVAALERCSLRQAAEKLSGWQGPGTLDARPWQPTVTKRIESVPPLGFRLRGVDLRHPYLGSRGISETTAAQFGVGYYAGPGLMGQRLVIPIDDEAGRLVGYAGRSLEGSEPRYKFPVGFAKSQVLFNRHRATATGQPTAIVVEGFFDCLKVHQAGFRSVVALMGSALSERQRCLLVQLFHDVTLLLDGDRAGRQASIAIAARLGQDCPVSTVRLSENAQPDQLSSQCLQEILAQKGGSPQTR
jgi:DNA primase